MSIIDYTIGRATNETLEKTVAVWFKSESEDDGTGAPIGPIWLQTAGEPPSDEKPYGGDDKQLIALAREEVEWHSLAAARALADELGVPLAES